MLQVSSFFLLAAMLNITGFVTENCKLNSIIFDLVTCPSFFLIGLVAEIFSAWNFFTPVETYISYSTANFGADLNARFFVQTNSLKTA